MISQNTIQQILSRIDIIDIVGSFVKLKKRGANYLGLCPFHNEKTPSFTVSPAKEIYKCFGCGRSGNSISFLMEHEKYSYVEALKWLANKYNVEVEETEVSPELKEKQQVGESLHAINSFAVQFFSKQLFETEEGQNIGLSYLKERGFREEVIHKFQVGYSPEQRDAFAKAALASQFNPELLQRSGLVVNRNDQLLDNYRGRIIFPVHNHSGKIIGFGARVIKSTDKAPKYINTPENELYIKSKILYGSYFARQAIDKSDECLLVEGYTDVISLHQAGIENVVASSGTSLTKDQIRLIKRYTGNLTIIYDGDAAGIKAAMRGLDMVLEEGLNLQLVLLPANHDPDSYLNEAGPQKFQEYIKSNKKDFLIFQLTLGLEETKGDRNKVYDLVDGFIENLSKISWGKDRSATKRAEYIKTVSHLLKIDENELHVKIREKLTKNLEDEAGKALPEIPSTETNEFSDTEFLKIWKDELQEREIARILLEYGNKKWDDEHRVSDYIFSEIIDESLFDNTEVLKLITTFKIVQQLDPGQLSKNYFIYHPDKKLSALAVSLLNFPYEESTHWKKEHSQSTGYQKSLFEQSYEDFIRAVEPGNEEKLMTFLKMGEDKTNEEVESAINYLKLRKIKRLLLENQVDLEKIHTPDEYETLHKTHDHLKQIEIALSRKMGAVIIK